MMLLDCSLCKVDHYGFDPSIGCLGRYDIIGQLFIVTVVICILLVVTFTMRYVYSITFTQVSVQMADGYIYASQYNDGQCNNAGQLHLY